MTKKYALMAIALLIQLAVAAPEPRTKSVKEIYTDIFGPVDTWTPIRLIDIDPTATIDGKPVDESVIYSYEPPTNITDEQHAEVSRRLAARDPIPDEATLKTRKLNRRGGYYIPSDFFDTRKDCWYSGNFVQQAQLFSAKDQFCTDTQGMSLKAGQSHWQDKRVYKLGNQWQTITNVNGYANAVFFEIRWHGPGNFNWNGCYDAFHHLIHHCKGRNPDVAGGNIMYWEDSYLTVRLDVQDF